MTKTEKYTLLKKGIVYDLIGMLSLTLPIIGPFTDILWTPYAARKMKQMYPGKDGTVAAIIVFIEEILPNTDVIPTFTLMWLYTFVVKKQTIFKTKTA